MTIAGRKRTHSYKTEHRMRVAEYFFSTTDRGSLEAFVSIWLIMLDVNRKNLAATLDMEGRIRDAMEIIRGFDDDELIACASEIVCQATCSVFLRTGFGEWILFSQNRMARLLRKWRKRLMPSRRQLYCDDGQSRTFP